MIHNAVEIKVYAQKHKMNIIQQCIQKCAGQSENPALSTEAGGEMFVWTAMPLSGNPKTPFKCVSLSSQCDLVYESSLGNSQLVKMPFSKWKLHFNICVTHAHKDCNYCTAINGALIQGKSIITHHLLLLLSFGKSSKMPNSRLQKRKKKITRQITAFIIREIQQEKLTLINKLSTDKVYFMKFSKISLVMFHLFIAAITGHQGYHERLVW